MADYFAFDPNPRTPHRAPPPRSCDSQFHVLGPREKYPVREGAAYEMPGATWEAALRMHKALGIERGIIVQPTTYGADHSVTLDGLAALGPNYKACANAVVLSERDDAYIARLDDAGVRGARYSRQSLGIALSKKELERSLARVKELGWYAKIQPEANGIAENIAPFERLDIPVLLDHMGRPDPRLGAEDPSLAKVVELLKRGNFWVMLSLSEKISKAGAPWDDVIPVARTLIDAAPDRVVWASDWPHPVSTKQPPNEADLLELLYRYVPDGAMLKKILVDNPARLFGFDQ
ncbi:MAG: 2-pyrone-4,6-dicarboxylate hydrolase [Betaproteobacteria bacterium]|nr:2-pyrone-4,6-dicarboxylate hydrolase [Betaproteobacteria bacterium]